MKIDMHVHTRHSYDSNMSPEELIAAAKARGLDAVGVVDHGTVKGGLETRERANGTGLLVIPGEEINTRSGEIIAFGIERDIPQGLSLSDTCRMIKEQGGFVVVPHPFDRFRSGVGNDIRQVIKEVDAMEAFNARTLFNSFNKRGTDLASEFGIPTVAGSDAHFPEEVGNAYVILDSAKTTTGVFSAIVKGRTRVVAEKSGLSSLSKRIGIKIKRALGFK